MDKNIRLLFIILPILIILVLLLGLIPRPKLTQTCMERFVDIEKIDPQALIKTLRTMLDKYDDPEIWSHAKRVHKMSPGELARL
jgi:hypothetical protein